MIGAIALVVVLLVVFPVVVMMSMTLIAALLGTTTKIAVDEQHADSELLELSESNPYQRA